MQIQASDIRAGMSILVRTPNSSRFQVAKVNQVTKSEVDGDAVFYIATSIDQYAGRAAKEFILAPENLVPKDKLDHYAKTLAYEVLVFHTKIEYENTEAEADLKKKIVAKFRDYNDALAYAIEQATKPAVFKVVLRA